MLSGNRFLRGCHPDGTGQVHRCARGDHWACHRTGEAGRAGGAGGYGTTGDRYGAPSARRDSRTGPGKSPALVRPCRSSPPRPRAEEAAGWTQPCRGQVPDHGAHSGGLGAVLQPEAVRKPLARWPLDGAVHPSRAEGGGLPLGPGDGSRWHSPPEPVQGEGAPESGPAPTGGGGGRSCLESPQDPGTEEGGGVPGRRPRLRGGSREGEGRPPARESSGGQGCRPVPP